jgi:phage baseplate assembly protein W
MSTYIGFSTINANKPKTTTALPGVDGGVGGILQPLNPGKKFRIVDAPLVLQDFINALNIQQGQKVGNPGYGTTLWSFIFDPNDATTQFKIEEEIKRIANSDPRLILNSVKSYVRDNGILLEVELAVAPFNDATTVNVFFNNLTNQATLTT